VSWRRLAFTKPSLFLARDAKRLNVMIPEGSPHGAMYFDGSRWFWTWSESDVDRHLE
jgi:hypothetical protein